MVYENAREIPGNEPYARLTHIQIRIVALCLFKTFPEYAHFAGKQANSSRILTRANSMPVLWHKCTVFAPFRKLAKLNVIIMFAVGFCCFCCFCFRHHRCLFAVIAAVSSLVFVVVFVVIVVVLVVVGVFFIVIIVFVPFNA